MDRRLLEACMSGDEQALQALIQHDPLILRRAVTCYETPLHVAVLCGHFRFVRALLGLQRELVSERDASGFLPLHLASAMGSARTVRELLRVNAKLCSARDHCGRTPLHLGIMKGRLDVVREFIRVCPLLASERFDRGETVFHLSIKYCRLEVLKLLVEMLKDDHPQLLVAIDNEGNTVLHFAAFSRQVEIVRYLVSLEGVKAIAQATNSNGRTALDIMMDRSPRDFNSFVIVETLIQVGVTRGQDQPNNPISIIVLPSPPPTTTNGVDTGPSYLGGITIWLLKYLFFLMGHYDMELVAHAHGNLMVVATVIPGMAFQAGINPPGGVWQADTIDNHTCTKPDMCRAGTAVFKDAKEFQWYGCCGVLMKMFMVPYLGTK